MLVNLSSRFYDATGHRDNLFKRLNESNVKQHILNKFFRLSSSFFPPGHKTAVLQKTTTFYLVVNSGLSSAAPSLLLLLIRFLKINVVSMVDNREYVFMFHLYPNLFVLYSHCNFLLSFSICEKVSMGGLKNKESFFNH